ncbi:FtsQ-type POTRA domain-containing protein [Streptomyces sp. SS7]|uniref:cell division protein FtsQ/DivIB n=1 Tax=Streptomyces sp. SS7 TaxID=3108485 RepID=UPI0030EF701A
MAGPATVERGARQEEPSGPPLVRRLGGPRRFRMMIIIVLTVLLLGGGTVWVLYGSPWTRVERVEVSGTDVLTPDQVREAAAVPVGSALVSVDTGAIAARLRARLPRIDTVDVVRSWPHGIGLKVTERQPVLLIGKGSNFVEVDDEGVRFATISRTPKNVPLLEMAVSARSGGSGAASLRRFGEDRLVREAVEVAGDIPDAVAQKTRALKVRSYDDISLELADGRTVAWGSADQGALKARTLGALMKASPAARHFDVSAPTAPASSGS